MSRKRGKLYNRTDFNDNFFVIMIFVSVITLMKAFLLSSLFIYI